MDLLGSFAIAFSMYSRIPMPYVSWTKKRMAYALCFFPLIGAVIGLCLYGAVSLLRVLRLEAAIPFAGAAIPLLITGGIHMDGFLDVTDARASHQDKEKKLEILKDPHTGAFAIIGFGSYMLLYLGAFFCLSYDMIPVLCAAFVLTRAFSGLSVVVFPKAKNTGLASTFGSQAEKRTVVLTMACYMTASFLFLVFLAGMVAASFLLAVCGIVFFYYYGISMKEFGGITGDLAGYFLQVCELAALIAVVILPRLYILF